MKKGDIAYIFDQKVIKLVEILGVRESQVDNEQQPTEYLVCTYHAAEPHWLTTDRFYVSPEIIIKELQADAAEQIKALYQTVYDTRYSNGKNDELGQNNHECSYTLYDPTESAKAGVFITPNGVSCKSVGEIL